jgi:hypothetical protein
MAKGAASPKLRQFEKHHEETEKQIERLESIFESRDAAARAIRCEPMDGILAEAKDMMDEIENAEVCDAGIPRSRENRRALRNRALWRAHRLGGSGWVEGRRQASRLNIG